MANHDARLTALENGLRGSLEGNVVIIRGGLPDNDVTEMEIADAAGLSKMRGGRLIVIGGLPDQL